MKLETKFNEGDKLFFLSKDKITEQEVESIEIKIKDSKANIRYWFKIKLGEGDSENYTFENKQEYQLFTSREELINSL